MVLQNAVLLQSGESGRLGVQGGLQGMYKSPKLEKNLPFSWN